jgi:hypothetical protein
MHEIDLMLKYQLEGKNKEARALSDKLEKIGQDKIVDRDGKNTQDIWFRHCFNRGWFLLQDGDFQAGSKLLEHGRFLNTYGSPPLLTSASIFNPEKDTIKGKSFIISLEGGYGDEIIHARFATSFKKQGASKVYLAAAPELVSVLSRIEGVDGVILRNQANTVQHDYWVPGFSAGWLVGHTFKDFPGDPYLTPKPESVEIWKQIISSDKVKVGIRWAGNPKFEHQQFRKFPENFMINLAKYKEVQVYSFQRDHNTVVLPNEIYDLQHLLLSWEDTMAAIANLDIMITSCTAIAHLSAAMGKETYVMVPILPYHTWSVGSPKADSSPYYKFAKIFRQREPGKWNTTFQKMYDAFEKKFNLEHIDMPNEDKVYKKLNLGCGKMKLEKFVNVDKDKNAEPDVQCDLSQTPWPFKDSEFDHIVAKDILEQMNENKDELIKTIKEMYRVSENGAVWEIQFAHPRSDIILDNPEIKTKVSIGFFNLLNQKIQKETIKNNAALSMISFDEGIDLEICDVQFDYSEPFLQRLRTNQISPEELIWSRNHLNNVVNYVKLLVQVHKPGRVEKVELENEIKIRASESMV